jgi:hypothetical protein
VPSSTRITESRISILRVEDGFDLREMGATSEEASGLGSPPQEPPGSV